jgi:hypothetical protein
MAIKQVTFADLVAMDDGVLAVAIDAALRRAAEDCEDRPGVKRARKITLNLEVLPVLDEDGIAEEVKYSFVMNERLPNRSSKEYTFGLRKNGVMSYNPEALDNHNQHTFDFEDKDKRKS